MEAQLNLTCREVKFTFFDCEFKIPRSENFNNQLTIASLLDFAAMKAYAPGRRSKWKEYGVV